MVCAEGCHGVENNDKGQHAHNTLSAAAATLPKAVCYWREASKLPGRWVDFRTRTAAVNPPWHTADAADCTASTDQLETMTDTLATQQHRRNKPTACQSSSHGPCKTAVWHTNTYMVTCVDATEATAPADSTVVHLNQTMERVFDEE